MCDTGEPPLKRRYGTTVLAALLLVLASGHSVADDGEAQEDQEIARSALLRGEVMPVREIVDAARAVVGNDLLRVELERENGRWIYEIKYVDETGHVRTLDLDARSGERIESESD